ncbi:unnamed protein product [Lasius platythorax]|uniref:Uncharacterized protein n=1 Tax=Lasius platythorax TaxID=488582 RepID=A0AAV2NIJ2_9HYME
MIDELTKMTAGLNGFPITDIARAQFRPARENLLQKIKSRYRSPLKLSQDSRREKVLSYAGRKFTNAGGKVTVVNIIPRVASGIADKNTIMHPSTESHCAFRSARLDQRRHSSLRRSGER